jgi:hypothetical protein
MKFNARTCFAAALAVMAVAAPPSRAQSNSRGQPVTPISSADFAKLHWLEGVWKGTSPGESPMVERYHFSTDSTIDITYFADSLTGRQTGTGRVNLSVGRVYYTLGPGRWGATRLDAKGVFFVPQVNAHNTYNWASQSHDAWTSTMRTGMGGREQVIVYQMQRVSP